MNQSNEGKSLRIPVTTPLGPGQRMAETVKTRWDTAEANEDWMRTKGLEDLREPVSACPEIKAEVLTSPDSKLYTEQYILLQSWFNYVSELHAKVQVRLLQYQNMCDVIAAQSHKEHREIFKAAGEKKPTEQELEDNLRLNSEYQEVLHQAQTYKQRKYLVEAKLDSLERSLRVVSRQVEIRRLDQDQTRTGANMPGRGGRNRFEAPSGR